jgi:hypothetical protein
METLHNETPAGISPHTKEDITIWIVNTCLHQIDPPVTCGAKQFSCVTEGCSYTMQYDESEQSTSTGLCVQELATQSIVKLDLGAA